MISYLIPLVAAFGIACILIPVVRSYAIKRGWFDPIDERKIHTQNTPRLGGVGIVLSFLVALLVFVLTHPTMVGGVFFGKIWPLVLGGIAMHLVGLVDDFTSLRARMKFIVQALMAAVLIAAGYRFRVILIPFGSGSLDLGLLSYPLTFFWIVGVTNALNLIDGLDGLSGGLSLIAALVFGIFFLSSGNIAATAVCFALVGSIGGYLVFNFPPAKIFMGDSGSLFIGFTLSALPLLGPADGKIEIGLISAVTILLIPILDTLSAILRRARAGVSFFSPDKGHLHHKLLSLGLSVPRVLSVVYPAAILLGLIALSTLFVPPALSFTLKLGSWLVYAFLLMVLTRATRLKGEAADHGTGNSTVSPDSEQSAP